ncbi:hypothetical protein NMY22_g20026 [Coprinellus aureogranulatus]|nr:hypothetical protein NMY22_g20026 [Coprinellus aureogranulatus]
MTTDPTTTPPPFPSLQSLMVEWDETEATLQHLSRAGLSLAREYTPMSTGSPPTCDRQLFGRPDTLPTSLARHF